MRITVYKTGAMHVDYGSETWTVCTWAEGRIPMAGCTNLGYKRNLDLMKKLNTQPVMECTANYRSDREKTCFSNGPLKNLQILCYQSKSKDLRRSRTESGMRP
jgi:hypothetical protein